MKINTNITALQALGNLTKVNSKLSKTMEKLSSGLRINNAADDAAGMAIANKLDAQVGGLKQAKRNAMDGISMIQTGEGALNEVHSMLQRMRELSVQAANGTYEKEDIQTMQAEVKELYEAIEKIQSDTEFNTMGLLNTDDNFILHVGANKGQTINVSGGQVNLNTVFSVISGVVDKLSTNAGDAISMIDSAIKQTSKMRSYFGACQNRLEYTVNNLGVSRENMESALSTIQDADMAEEMCEYTQQNIISQSAVAMLSQANQLPQQLLQLLNS